MEYAITIVCANEDDVTYTINFHAKDLVKVGRVIDSYIPKKGFVIVNINVQTVFTLF